MVEFRRIRENENTNAADLHACNGRSDPARRKQEKVVVIDRSNSGTKHGNEHPCKNARVSADFTHDPAASQIGCMIRGPVASAAMGCAILPNCELRRSSVDVEIDETANALVGIPEKGVQATVPILSKRVRTRKEEKLARPKHKNRHKMPDFDARSGRFFAEHNSISDSNRDDGDLDGRSAFPFDPLAEAEESSHTHNGRSRILYGGGNVLEKLFFSLVPNKFGVAALSTVDPGNGEFESKRTQNRIPRATIPVPDINETCLTTKWLQMAEEVILKRHDNMSMFSAFDRDGCRITAHTHRKLPFRGSPSLRRFEAFHCCPIASKRKEDEYTEMPLAKLTKLFEKQLNIGLFNDKHLVPRQQKERSKIFEISSEKQQHSSVLSMAVVSTKPQENSACRKGDGAYAFKSCTVGKPGDRGLPANFSMSVAQSVPGFASSRLNRSFLFCQRIQHIRERNQINLLHERQYLLLVSNMVRTKSSYFASGAMQSLGKRYPNMLHEKKRKDRLALEHKIGRTKDMSTSPLFPSFVCISATSLQPYCCLCSNLKSGQRRFPKLWTQSHRHEYCQIYLCY